MNILNWIIKSSADPTKTSLTLKAGIPFVIIAVGWFGYVSPELSPLLNDLINAVVNALALATALATGVYSVYGLARKIYLSLK